MLMPEPCTVESIERLTQDVFTVTLIDAQGKSQRPFMPGQFNMLYHFGFGEVAISISGDPEKQEGLKHTIRAVGNITEAFQKMKPGDSIGVRGPFGSHWPIEHPEGDVLVIAGGLGIAPLRPTLLLLDRHRERYNRVALLYGSRSPSDLLFLNDIEAFKKRGMHVGITVDKGSDGWRGNVGVVTGLIANQLLRPEKTLVHVCGPEIMMRFAVQELLRYPIDNSKLFLSLERNMQCAVGFCGHCQFGPHFVCKDGPVFPYTKLKHWLNIHEL